MFYNQQNLEITQNRKFYEDMYDRDHHLVRIEKEMNWNIVYKLMKPFYRSPVGRPSVDPLILVKILLIQYIEGFRSVRFTCKQVKQNATYRWFLGIFPHAKIPCHSTISKFLTHRIQGASIWEELFQYILHQIQKDGFLSRDIWIADETELKANANKRKREVWLQEVEVKEDIYTLEKVNKRRMEKGKKPFLPRPVKIETKRILKSPTDPDARLSVKHDVRGRFAYFEHRIVDGLHNFIIDTHITPANVPGHRILLDRIECVKGRLGYIPKEIALDAGYYNARLAEGLFQKKLFSYISYRRYANNEHPECKKSQFTQINEDLFACPCGIPFSYKTTTRNGYHEYKPEKGSCTGCPFAKKTDRVLRISVHEDIYHKLRNQRLSYRGKILRFVRPSTVELSFAQSKELHGLRFARYRGVQKVTIQALLTAIIQNLIKWTKLLSLKKVGLYLTYQITDEIESENVTF